MASFDFIGDLRHATRQLGRRPGLAITAIIALAVGIGATTAIFTAVDAILLRPLAYRAPGELTELWSLPDGVTGSRGGLSGPDFLTLQEQARSFSTMAAFRGGSFNLSGGDVPERLSGAIVSPRFFELLGPPVLLGQPFSATQASSGERLAVLHESLWQRRYGGRDVVGQSITVNGEPARIVAVVGGQLRVPDDAQLWLTSKYVVPEHPLRPATDPTVDRSSNYLEALGRLAPGATSEAADRELALIAGRIKEADGDPESPAAIRAVPLQDSLVGEVRPTLLLLSGAVALILLVACANVANLLLARALSRSQEIAVRIALGAARSQLLRMFFVESLVLVGIAAVIGVWLASWAAPALVSLAPSLLPKEALGVDWRVFLFATAIALLVSSIFAVVPALARDSVGAAVREGVRTATGGGRKVRARATLVAVEVALSLVLLIGAALLGQSFRRLQQVDPGFEPEGVLAGSIWLPDSKYPTRESQAAFYRSLVERLRALPEVELAGATSRPPLSGGNSGRSVTVPGRAAELPPLSADFRVATSGYFEAMRIPLKHGRTFGDADRDSARVVVINEAFAKLAFGAENPVGRFVRVTTDGQESEIIGVVGNLRHSSLEVAPRPEVYVAVGREAWPFMTVMLRTRVPPSALAARLQAEVLALDSQLPVSNVGPMEARVARSLASRRFALTIVGAVAAVALLLAVTGIYGVTAYVVSLRTREVGVRLALGARPSAVLRMVMREGLTPVLIGAGAGVVFAGIAAWSLQRMLYGVSAGDPLTYVVLPLALVATAALACFIAGRRATQVDPAITLRAE